MAKKPWYEDWKLWAIVAFLALFVWGMQDTLAAEYRLGVAKGVTNDNDWVVQEFMLSNRGWYLSAAVTGNDHSLRDTWRYALGYRVNWRDETELAPYMRFGAAYWKERPLPLISDHWSYDMSVGVRAWRVVELEWQHNSTAGRSDFNKGNDLVLLGLVFRF